MENVDPNLKNEDSPKNKQEDKSANVLIPELSKRFMSRKDAATQPKVETMLDPKFYMIGATAKESKIDVKNMKEDEERWSQLPTLLVWMIIDRLNMADKSRLGFVCKNWDSASQTCPSKAPQRGVVPWLMRQCPSSRAYEFINVSTMEKFIVDRPECHDATYQFFFSRRGWLLFQDSRRIAPKNPVQHSVVLLNPHTNAKIIMPSPGGDMGPYMASFSSYDDGTPRYVVFASCAERHVLLYVGDAGDKKWTFNPYENGRPMEGMTSLLALGHHAYILGDKGTLFIFDMTSLRWREIAGKTPKVCTRLRFQWWIVELEERVVKIDRGGDLKTFSFFKLNDSQSGWEELSDKEVMDTSWFLFSRNNYVAVKGTAGMKKVYHFDWRKEKSPNNTWITGPLLRVHNLISGSVQRYKAGEDRQWVDLGWFDKLPPYCASYVPSPGQCDTAKIQDLFCAQKE